jgi:integrase
LTAKPAGQRHRVLDSDEVKRLWRVWEDEFTAAGRPLIGEQFKLRLLTAQRGGEVVHLLWSAIDLDAGLWTKAFQLRKRKPTDMHQRAHLVPLAPMAVAVLRKLKEDHERERVRNNAEYGARGTARSMAAGRASTSRTGSFRVARIRRTRWRTSLGRRTPS